MVSTYPCQEKIRRDAYLREKRQLRQAQSKNWSQIGNYRSRHSAWKNSCDSLTFEGLHENWMLALRFQVFRRRRISRKKARAGLKPDDYGFFLIHSALAVIVALRIFFT